jgi:succinoglycan biosynthesis protein ExoH
LPKFPLDTSIKERISIIRYPLIYFIVVVHVPRISGFIDDPTLLSFIGSLVYNLTRLGIPMLTCISGFLLFHNELDRNFPRLLRKRFVSLVIPLLVWNIPLVLGLYLVQSQGLVDYQFAARKTMYPFDLMTWINGVLSITDYPINYPMHFLRDLFVMCIFAPWIGKLLRSLPFTGLIAMFVIFVLNLDGQLIRNDTMIISFYVGGMAATMNWDLKRLDRYAILLICLLILICALGVSLRVGKLPWLPFLAPFVVWPASSMMLGTRAGRWLIDHSRASVFLFMFHGLFLLSLKAAFPTLYTSQYAWLVWFAVPVMAAMVSQFVFLFFDRFFPASLVILMGGRKKSAPKVSRPGG